MQVLNPEPIRRTEGADRLAVELVEAARALPDTEARTRLAKLAGGLHSLDPMALAGDDTRLAFWINVHNALVLAGRDAGANRPAWIVGGRRYTPALIEHGLLRGNARAPGAFFRVARGRDPRLAAAPRNPDPRALFALLRGTDDVARTVFSGSLATQLDLATRAQIATHSRVDRDAARVVLPRLLRACEIVDRLGFAAKHLPRDDGEWILANRDRIEVAFTG